MTAAALAWSAFVAEAGLAAIMAGAWAIERRTGNSRWIDACWTFGVGAMGALLALAPDAAGAPVWRGALVATLTAVWALQLGLHIVARALKAGDDPRYRALIENWGAAAPGRLLGLLQAQALFGAVMATAAALAAKAPASPLRPQDVLAAALLAAALFGQALVDAQLAQFKADPANRGAICDVGLWKLVRRPNDVLEWLVWLAYPVFAIDPTGDRLGWLALAAPALAYWALRAPPSPEEPTRAGAVDERRAPIFFPAMRRPAR